MNIFLLIVVVVLLGVVVAVTLGKTRWERKPLEQAERDKPLEKPRVSGGDDD
jgi:hypothetical protein